MRIAYVCTDPGIPVFGTKGASVHIQEVVREYRRRGHEVVVHAVRRGTEVPEDLADLRVVEYPITETDPAARERAQARVSGAITKVLLLAPVDMVHERYSLFSTVLAEVTTHSGARGVLEVNAPLIDEQRTHRILVDEVGAREALGAQVRAAAATVCVSRDVRAWVLGHVGEAAGRVHSVPNGVSTTRITPVSEDPDRVVVTFVGTLKPWHGVEDLLVAASRRRAEWSLRIIGDGPQRPALEAMAAALGLEVDFRGAVAPAQIMDHLEGSAIGVAPYPLVAEGQSYFSPLKVYEYMAAGLPVVASDIGQISSVLDGFGTMVPPSDPEALAAAIDQLARDPELRARESDAARQAAVTKHSWTQVVDTILALADAGSR